MPRLTGRLVPASIGLALGLLSAPALAAEPTPARFADLAYNVYVGGLRIFSFDVEMALLPESYRLTAEGQTQGMVSWVYTFDMNLTAEGFDRGGRIEPQRYLAETQWQSRERKLQLGFADAGRYDLTQDPPPEPDPDIEGSLPKALPEGVVDPLSLAIAASRALEQTGTCNQTLPVFDGQRRFNVTVKQLGPATLPPNDYSIYQGPAMRCGLDVERISGFRKSFRADRDREARSTPPTIWMASIRPGLPPVPVRYEGEIKLGKIVIHLTDATFRTEAAEAKSD
jgi:hypothetical protein